MPVELVEVLVVGAPFLAELGWDLGDAEAEQIVNLLGKDDDRNPAREAGRHWIGNELDRRAQSAKAHHDQHDSGDERSYGQSVVAMSRHDGENNDDERAGRAADLNAAPAQCRDKEAGDDGGEQSALG